MIRNHEQDEFVAVRVQDPRIQNEGNWNSYVDYKIFLHTNSKAFTAKTSCVRRRYSEFVWLKKRLQKNTGLVPVPDLPGKSFFFFSNEDFLEGRRKGLQVFLDRVVHMTVCLSDSQLHLFLQTQLPVAHIQDCVQGLTPYTVMDAILTYASSNQGLAQAQENFFKESGLTVSYESMESPAPHQPCQQTNTTFDPERVSHVDSDPLEDILELCEHNSDDMPHQQNSSVRISQKCDHLEITLDPGPAEAIFYLGEVLEDSGSLSSADEMQQRSSVIQTPVEVHSSMGTGCEDLIQESVRTADPDDKTDAGPENVDVNDPEVVLGLKSSYSKGQVLEGSAASQEEEVLENQVLTEVSEVQVGHIKKCDDSAGKEETSLQPGVPDESQLVNGVSEVDGAPKGDSAPKGDGAPGGMLQEVQREVEQEEYVVSAEEDGHSMPSSNESIMECSEDSPCEETEAADVYLRTCPQDIAHWSEVSENLLNLHINGCLGENRDVSPTEEEGLRYMADLRELKTPPGVLPAVADGHLTEASDFSVLETSGVSAITLSKRAEQELMPSLSLGASEETPEVEMW